MTATQTRWWTFAIVCIALFMSMLDNLVVTTALPAIQRALHASVSDLEWTINAYTLAFAVLMMTGAALGDRFGRKRIFLVGVAVFTAGSASAAMSDTSLHLAVSRAVQGLGAAFLTPLTLTLLSRVFPEEQRAAAIGLWAGVSGLGLAIGPLVGGAIVSGVAWNAIFWVNVPVGIVVLLLGALRLEESRGDVPALDLPGLGLAGFGLLGIVYGLVRGNSLGWSSAEIVGSLVGGAVVLLAFIAWERSARMPMLRLDLFRKRGFSVSNGVGFLMSAGMFGSIFLLTLFIQDVQHATPLEAGIKTMPWTGTIMVVAPVAGIIAQRIGSRPVVTLGMALQAIALFWIGGVSTATTPYTSFLPPFIVGGLGMGLTFSPLAATVIASVSGNLQGQASGAYNAIRELGGVFGVAILGAIFQHVVTRPSQFLDGFHAAVFAGAIVVTVGAAASVLLPALRGEAMREVEATPAPERAIA